MLVAEQAGVAQRFTALPDPEGRGTADLAQWRAAFALPLELLRDGGTSYHLEGPAGRRFELPTPVEALPDGRPSQERERSLPERRRRSQAELRAFVERIAELRGQVEQLRETRRQFEARMKELETQLEHARSGEAVGEAEQRTG
jgi:hypothetical protein